MQTVIFDLDGTLADTSADLIAAANARLEQAGLGRPLDPAEDAATAFRGGRAMLRLGLQRNGRGGDAARIEAEIDALFPGFLALYEATIDTHTRTYDGVEAALDRLAARGARLGVCTNKPVGLAEILLDRLGLAGRFASVVGAGSLPVRKPDPAPLLAAISEAGGSPDSAVLVGDTATDRDTARAAGIPCVLVTFGPEGEAVRALAPEGLLPHYDRLDQVLARLAAD